MHLLHELREHFRGPGKLLFGNYWYWMWKKREEEEKGNFQKQWRDQRSSWIMHCLKSPRKLKKSLLHAGVYATELKKKDPLFVFLKVAVCPQESPASREGRLKRGKRLPFSLNDDVRELSISPLLPFFHSPRFKEAQAARSYETRFKRPHKSMRLKREEKGPE